MRERAVGVEYTYGVDVDVSTKSSACIEALGGCHRDAAVRADGYAGRPAKMCQAGHLQLNGMYERAVGVEDLDAVVAVVGHGDHTRQPPGGRGGRGGTG